MITVHFICDYIDHITKIKKKKDNRNWFDLFIEGLTENLAREYSFWNSKRKCTLQYLSNKYKEKFFYQKLSYATVIML